MIIGTNFGKDNGAGYYETNQHGDTCEITYIPETEVIFWPGEYEHIEYYLETPGCDEYNGTKPDLLPKFRNHG